MAEKRPSLKDKQRAAALGCAPNGTAIGSRITQLTDLDTDLTALADMSLAAMRARWQEVSDKPVPRVRRTLLRLALAYELQAAVHGGLSRRTEQRLAYLAGKNSAANAPRPGMRLVREWNGALHTVTIDADGLIHWEGKSWRSLSKVARVTLNMLLSFAQFEREVTAERIRDKIAASKAKGMWMGGIPPLGYKPHGRTLVVVEEHAALVRSIFERYRKLGNVRLVAESLKNDGLHCPRRKTASGKAYGGNVSAAASQPRHNRSCVQAVRLCQKAAATPVPDGVDGYGPAASNFSGRPLPYAPKLTLTAGIEYEVELAGGASLTPRLDWSHNSTQFQTIQGGANDLMAPRDLINAQLRYENGIWDVTAYVTNLTDETYVVGQTYGPSWFLGRPRQYGVRVGYNF